MTFIHASLQETLVLNSKGRGDEDDDEEEEEEDDDDYEDRRRGTTI